MQSDAAVQELRLIESPKIERLRVVVERIIRKADWYNGLIAGKVVALDERVAGMDAGMRELDGLRQRRVNLELGVARVNEQQQAVEKAIGDLAAALEGMLELDRQQVLRGSGVEIAATAEQLERQAKREWGRIVKRN